MFLLLVFQFILDVFDTLKSTLKVCGDLYNMVDSGHIPRKMFFGSGPPRLSVFCCRKLEKHLLNQDAVEALLDGVVAEGVQKFRTPSGHTISRTL